jgi:hypothetical protein
MANTYQEAKRKARETSILDVARHHDLLRKLKKVGVEYVGPCPGCGGADRFGINSRKINKHGNRGVFGCRRCEAGGDVIALEQFLKGTKFRQAVKDLSGAPIVEEDPSEAARKARYWRFLRETIEETVSGLAPILGSSAEIYLRDERCIDTTLPEVKRALENVSAIGWHPSVYFSQDDPSKPLNELHGRRLGCIVGVMVNPATGERLGPIARTYLHRGKKVGKAKTLKRAESERLGVVRVSPEANISQLGVVEGLETALAFLEMSGVPVWSAGSDSGLRFFPVVDGVEQLLIGVDNDATRPGERGASERAGRELRSRWLGAGRKARLLIPPGFKTDFNDVLMEMKGRAK